MDKQIVYDFKVTTNNGVELQNKLIKCYVYLKLLNGNS